MSSTDSSSDKNINDKLKENAERTTINIVRDEYSKSGGDHVVAEQVVASYSPSYTHPQRQKDIAGRSVDVNPLEVSPANTGASMYTLEKDGHPEKGLEKQSTSKRGSPAKGRSAESIKQRVEETTIKLENAQRS